MPNSFYVSPQLLVALCLCVALLVALILLSRVPLSYNVRNLLVRWRVSLLTGLAFTLVVSLLTVMLAFVNGMTRLTEASGQPGNVMILSDGATDELFSNLPKSDTTNVERQPGVERALLQDEDGVEREYPLCTKEVYIVVNQPVVPAEPPDTTATLRFYRTRSCWIGLGLVVVLAICRVPWWLTGSVALGFTAVIVVLTILLALPSSEEIPTHRGKVKAVTPEKREFIVTTLDDKDVTFHVSEEGRKTLLDHIKVDDRVSVAYETKGQELFATKIGVSNRRRFVQVRGIEDHRVAERVHGMELFPGGQWWGGAGVDDSKKEENGKGALPLVQAVLGEGAARVLGADKKKERLEVGETFELGPRKWIVTGIMQSAGSTFGSEIWAKHSIVGPMFGKDQFTCLVARTKDAAASKTLADFLSKEYKPAVRAEPELEYYAKLSETNRQFSVAIYFVTIIMAIGGVFGVMNTMFAAISQRIKDIGVLRILGFARRQILVSFFLETLTIAVVGGLIGCLIGWFFFDGLTATSIVSAGQGGGKTVVLKLVVDAQVLAVGVLFTLIMGALGGLVPSLSAMRLRPLESLR
jgi:ABC-type lipoprotein release transport system permease subunit